MYTFFEGKVFKVRVSVFAFWRFSLLSKKDYCVETGALSNG